MEGSIDLVGRMMCEECDAFLGKAHKETCSKKGRVVEQGDATEKFTTVEHADREEPMIGLNADTVELILAHMSVHEHTEDPAEVEKLMGGLRTFVAAAREVEGA
jgi:hypothetical protein